ncbi:MAG: GNAT family N-acetyltransferase [Bacilli bacterium]|nr:GNAT family N-acetyltransferase [Bacilli bacterium]
MYRTTIPYIETNRLILREIEEDDAYDMFEYAHLPNVGPVAGWAPHKRLSETRAVISLFHEKKLNNQLGTVAIILKENNKMIGTVELHTFTPMFKAELGYTVNPEYWGRGIAVEASANVLEWGFKTLKLKRIECSAFIDNERSKRVCEKLRLPYEGIRKKAYQLYDGSIHDLRCYAITDDEFNSEEYQKHLSKIMNK